MSDEELRVRVTFRKVNTLLEENKMERNEDEVSCRVMSKVYLEGNVNLISWMPKECQCQGLPTLLSTTPPYP